MDYASYKISINTGPAIFITILLLFTRAHLLKTKKIKDIQFKNDLIFSINSIGFICMLFFSKLYKQMPTTVYNFLLIVWIIIMALLLREFINKTNKKIVAYRKFVFSIFVLFSILFMGSIYGPVFDFKLGRTDLKAIMEIRKVTADKVIPSEVDDRGYIGSIISLLLIGLSVICADYLIRKGFKERKDEQKEQQKILKSINKYHRPVSTASIVTYYSANSSSIKSEDDAVFYKYVIEKDYWNYWKENLPEEMEKYNSRLVTNETTRKILFDYEKEFIKGKSILENFYTRKVLPIYKFAITNGVFEEIDKKKASNHKELKQKFLKINDTISKYLITLSSNLYMCQNIKKDMEDNDNEPYSLIERSFYFHNEKLISYNKDKMNEMINEYSDDNILLMRTLTIANKTFTRIYKNMKKEIKNSDLFKPNKVMEISGNLSKEEIEYISETFLE